MAYIWAERNETPYLDDNCVKKRKLWTCLKTTTQTKQVKNLK